MKKLLFTLLFLFIGSVTFVNATETTQGDITGTETSTLKIVEPYIMGIKVLPENPTVVAGEQLQLSVVALWSNDSTPRTATANWQVNKYINQTGIFTTTNVGNYLVNVSVGDVKTVTNVRVIPASLNKIDLVIKEVPVYGRVYNLNDIAACKGYDIYDNEVPIQSSDVKYVAAMDETIGYLLQWVGTSTGNPKLDIILARGAIRENGNVLFFEKGKYKVSAYYKEFLNSKIIQVEFDDRYKDVKPWSDYHLTGIDFEKKVVNIAFDIGGIVIPHSFTISDNWLKKFDEISFLSKLQVLCWIHYKILEIRQTELKNYSNRMFIEMIMKPILGKYNEKAD